MSLKLAVFTPQLGTVSETFIRRHVEDLCPGATVVVAWASTHPLGGYWTVASPVLYLDRESAKLTSRLARRAGVSAKTVDERAVRRFLQQQNVDIVLGEYLHLFVEFVPLLEKLGLPYVVQGHGIDVSAALREPGKAGQYLAYKSARAVLTRSELHRRRLIELGLPAEKVHVNPGGVGLPVRVPERGPQAAKRFLAVGRMTAKKGPLRLLEAFRLAASQDSELMLDYVGDGELWPEACKVVEASGLRDRVRLHGAAADEVKNRLFGECGVFAQHSMTNPETGDEEGLPAAIQEAMAHGLAVVSTQHAGIPDAVEHGVSGLLVPEGDTHGMAQAMLKVSAEAALCIRMGAAGRRKAEQIYTWPAERARLLRHFHAAERH